jgi:hypothetical protein
MPVIRVHGVAIQDVGFDLPELVRVGYRCGDQRLTELRRRRGIRDDDHT